MTDDVKPSSASPLTPAAEKDVREVLELGLSYRTAADYAGIDMKDLTAALKDPEFAAKARRWRAVALVYHAARARLKDTDKAARAFSEDFIRRYDQTQ